MNFKQYITLAEKVEKADISDRTFVNGLCVQLRTVIQTKHIAQDNFKKFIKDCNAWEKNIEKCILEELAKAGGQE